MAVLELLSPANKNEPGRADYLLKRQAVLRQMAHLIEANLLFFGRRQPMARPLPPGDFFAFVSRAPRRPNGEVYHWSVQDPLPMLPIPLAEPDPDVDVSLADVFNYTYRRGRCHRSLDYQAPPPTSLASETRNWIRAAATD